jgi:ATP-dependent 26S proteasome regulatory subunit
MATNRIGTSTRTALDLKLQKLIAHSCVDILDPGLLRPGRIDRKIEFPPPNPEARVTILRIHSRKVSVRRLSLTILSD